MSEVKLCQDHDCPLSLEVLLRDIARSALDAGRNPADVTLVAVSKTYGPEHLLPFLQAGLRVFGENRVQEASEKWPSLQTLFKGVELHLVGSLQSNKAKAALALFDVLHSVDRSSLVEALARAQDDLGLKRPVFLQVNTGEEPQKGGVLPSGVNDLYRQALDAGLDVRGLMAVPPADQLASPHFAWLAQMNAHLGLPWLSMGMSGDYRQAVQLGATHLRVGSALFGQRVM